MPTSARAASTFLACGRAKRPGSLKMKHEIRPIRMEDAADISALLDWAWFPQRSEESWRWLCRTPRSQTTRSIPVGYVVEDDDGRVAGVFGLFAQDYVSPEGSVSGGTGHTLVVHPRIRGASRPLIDAVLDQPSLFAVTVLNANDLAAPIYLRHGMTPMPEGRGDLSLVWITDPIALLAERAARVSKAKLNKDDRPSVERFLHPRLFETDLVRLGDRILALGPTDLDARIDTFWTALAAEGRLTARRDVASMRWRMSNPDRTRDPILLAWMEGSEIGGLLLADISKVTQIDAPTLEIIDLVALEHCAHQAAPDLVTALIRNASRLGCARVRLSVVTATMEQRLASVQGARKRRGHVHGHVLTRPGSEAMIRDWRLTPYDGEYGFCLRYPPHLQVQNRAA